MFWNIILESQLKLNSPADVLGMLLTKFMHVNIHMDELDCLCITDAIYFKYIILADNLKISYIESIRKNYITDYLLVEGSKWDLKFKSVYKSMSMEQYNCRVLCDKLYNIIFGDQHIKIKSDTYVNLDISMF